MTTTTPERLATLVRETATGVGELVGRHLKLARLELAADVRSLGKRAGVTAVFAVSILIGYLLTAVGLAAYVGGVRSMGKALLAMGLLHLAGGVAGIFGVLRWRARHLMEVTADELSSSVASVRLPPPLPPPRPRGATNGT